MIVEEINVLDEGPISGELRPEVSTKDLFRKCMKDQLGSISKFLLDGGVAEGMEFELDDAVTKTFLGQHRDE